MGRLKAGAGLLPLICNLDKQENFPKDIKRDQSKRAMFCSSSLLRKAERLISSKVQAKQDVLLQSHLGNMLKFFLSFQNAGAHIWSEEVKALC